MPSSKFLFWNIGGKPLNDAIVELVAGHNVDVLILVECKIDPAEILVALNPTRGRAEFHYALGLSKAIRIFTRFSAAFLIPIYESDRSSIRRLMLPARLEILLAATHLPSKLHFNSDSQAYECSELARQIIEAEDRIGHRRTILVGDFNMNPFEHGIVAAGGLHAVSSRAVANREARTVQGREYPFFYNPMWNHFGDAANGTAGSYFYDKAEHVNYFWNVFDQVLIRPTLTAGFDASQLKILTSAGSRALIRQDGRPDATAFSDHLPLVFELEF